MRILILSINYSPELTGIGKYNGEMAEWLAAKGHEVQVITAPPYYPSWKIKSGYTGYWYSRENINGVSIWRCPLWVPREPSGLKRIAHLMSFAISSLPIMISKTACRPDIIFVVEPPLFCAPAAWLLARITRAKCWLHIQDYEVDAAFELGMLPRQLEGISNFLEKFLTARFDRISSISSNMVKRLATKGVAQNKRVYFPNWVDIQRIYPLERASKFRKMLGIKSKSLVSLYSGNMGEKQGLEVIIEAAAQLKDNQHFQFVLCGEGAALSKLKKLAEHASNIHWIPLQPLEDLNELLGLADVHLLPQRADAEGLVLPSKLTGMLASGRPVIATANEGTQVAEIVGMAGMVVRPGDPFALVGALKGLVAEPELCRRLGKAGREYAVNTLSQGAVLTAFEHDLRNCI